MTLKQYTLLSILLLPFLLCAEYRIEHIEPMNWWIGMKNPKVQLLVHGENIGELHPHVQYAGVKIEKMHRADSKNYLFIDLLISPTTLPGGFDIEFKKGGTVVLTHTYTLYQRQPEAAQVKGFGPADAIYLITPDRFCNGDYSNDVVAGMKESKINRFFDGGRHGGDIKGIINSLDYIANLGFTAIWPTPMLENDMPRYSYHGYAITNHYKVDPRFGTLEDYKELSIKAKAKGIKLIFDGVINHTGLDYWWMNDLPFKNWINYPDSFVSTNHRRTVNQDLYASQYDKDIMTKGWFVRTMPDINGQNPFLATYLIQNSIWWIETLHLGGIRQDTYCYSDKDFSQKWSCGIMTEYPNFSIVGEEWSNNPLITSYWQEGKKNHDGYVSCVKSSMDFPLNSALIQGLNESDNSDMSKGLTQMYEALANDFVYSNPKNVMVFGDNHDMDRLYTQLGKDADLTRMALAYLFTIRGIPQMYYGTEILMDNSSHRNNHGVIRSDFPGGWKDDVVNAFNGNGLNKEQLETQAFIQKILKWRATNTAVISGETMHFAPFDGVYVYFRYNKDEKVMVILNKNPAIASIDTKRFAEIMRKKPMVKNVLTGEKYPLGEKISILGKSTLIFEID